MLRVALLLILVTQFAAAASHAADPPQLPMLRLEAGGHLGAIPALALDRSGQILATAGYDKTVRLWSVETGGELAVLRPPIGDREEGEIYAVAMSPDGRQVFAGGATGGQWDGRFSVYAFDTLGAGLRLLSPLPAPINSLAVSPNGQLLAIGLAVGGVQVWTTEEQPRRVFADRAYAGPIRSVAWSVDRLFTTAADGRLRAYSQSGQKLAEFQAAPGLRPWGLAVSPDGGLVALTFENAMRIDVLGAETLNPVFRPDMSGLAGEGLLAVAWISDGCCGAQLVAAGYARTGDRRVIRRWADYGLGVATDMPAARDTILALVPVPGGGAIYGTEDPDWGRLSPDGRIVRSPRPPMADLRPARETTLAIGADGTLVEFMTSTGRLRFDAAARQLGQAPRIPDPQLSAGRSGSAGLDIDGWRDGSAPRLNGVPLALGRSEIARSVAVLPDGSGVLLGTDNRLVVYARNGRTLGEVPVPAAAWAVGVADSGSVAVAALLDGTLRWYGLDRGALLQQRAILFVPADGQRWVLFTPEGLFDHAEFGGQTLVGIHLNRGRAQRPEWTTLSQAYRVLYAPTAVLANLRGDPEPARARLAELGNLRQRLSRQPSIEIAQACVPQAGDACALVARRQGMATYLPQGAGRLRIKLLAEDRGLGMGAVDVFVNERNAGRFAAPNAAGTKTELTVEVPLDAGENSVQVRLYDRAAAIFAEAPPLRLIPAPGSVTFAAGGKGRLHVLAMGVNRFTRPELTLRSAAEDAEDFAGLIRQVAPPLFGGVEVTLLLNEEATRARVLAALDRIAAVSRPEDTFLFYAASHGVRDGARERFLLIPHDAGDPVQGGALARSALDEATLVGALSRIRARDAMVLLDTCHAGQLEVEELAGVGQETGRYLLAASGSQEEALDSYDDRNGVFLTAVREALSGRASQDENGVVEALSLGQYVSRRVRQLARERGHSQSAVFRAAQRDLRSFPIGQAARQPAAGRP